MTNTVCLDAQSPADGNDKSTADKSTDSERIESATYGSREAWETAVDDVVVVRSTIEFGGDRTVMMLRRKQ